jgi:hypothetical protein
VMQPNQNQSQYQPSSEYTPTTYQNNTVVRNGRTRTSKRNKNNENGGLIQFDQRPQLGHPPEGPYIHQPLTLAQ